MTENGNEKKILKTNIVYLPQFQILPNTIVLYPFFFATVYNLCFIDTLLVEIAFVSTKIN